MSEYRIETDSIGEVKVEDKFYWGAQTQRSINNFKIAGQKMPNEVIKALAILKSSAAKVHSSMGGLDKDIANEAPDIARNEIALYESRQKQKQNSLSILNEKVTKIQLNIENF